MDVIDPEKSFSRQREKESADKVFPETIRIQVTLDVDAAEMEKVRVWYKKTRYELGDDFVADIPVPKLIFEAFAGGANNPKVVEVKEL